MDQVMATRRDEFEILKLSLPTNLGAHHLLLSDSYSAQVSLSLFLSLPLSPSLSLSQKGLRLILGMQVWLVGEGLRPEEQEKAPKGARFIPFSQFPPKKARKDCVYHSTPAMVIPKAFENMHACEVNSTDEHQHS